MALNVRRLEEDNRIVAYGRFDGTVPLRFAGSGACWTVHFGQTWAHAERDRHPAGRSKRTQARQKISAAIARLRAVTKPAFV